MDSELLQLQKLFEAAQEAKASVRLSERNVVELVTKLQELCLLDSDLLHTVSGREYLTQDHLKVQMENEIKRLGRVSVIDLASTIGVDLFYCERQAEGIVASCDNLMLVQGEIISTSYWDSVAEEINESLQEAGRISLAELAARLNVSAELMTAVLEPRLGKVITGKMEGGQLYTQGYVARIRAMIRGAIRALTVPTNLSAVWSSLQQQLQEMDEIAGGGVPGEGQLFQALFNGLLKEEAFSGTLRGGGSVWTPAVFEKAQCEGVESFYSQNSYIGYDMLRRLAISQPKQFLQGKYGDGIALDTVFIHSSVMNMLDAAAEEIIDAGGWVDGVSVVPPLFTTADVAKLVSLCPSIQMAQKESKAVILAETCLVSISFLKSLLERLENEIVALARMRPAAHQVKDSSQNSSKTSNSENRMELSTFGDGKETSYRGNNMQGKGGKRKGTGIAVSDSAEEESITGKGSKGKKKGGKGRGGTAETGLSSNKAVKSALERPAVSHDDEVISEEQIARKIIEWFPETEGVGTDDEVVGGLSTAMAAYLKPSIVVTWKKMKQASFTAAAEDRHHRAETLQKKIDELYAGLQLFTKALDVFEDDQLTLVTLQRHLLRTTSSDIVDLILQGQNVERRLDEGEIYKDLPSSTARLSTSERLALAKGLHGLLSAKSVRIVETLDGKAVDAFDSALGEVVEECGLRLKKLDKKGEKALLLSFRKTLALEIEKESDPVALLPKVVQLIFAQTYNKALQAPGRAIAAVIKYLKNRIPDVAYTTLVEYQSATVALLSMLSTTTPGGTDCTSDRIQDKREVLETLMPNLKATVLSSQFGL